jgi:hypothetical protein
MYQYCGICKLKVLVNSSRGRNSLVCGNTLGLGCSATEYGCTACS